MLMVGIVPLRRDVPVEHTWNTASIFATPHAWEQAFAQVQERLSELETFKGRLGSNAKVLADWFETSEQIEIVLNQVMLYARLNYVVDTMDQESLARQDRARGLSSRFSSATALPTGRARR